MKRSIVIGGLSLMAFAMSAQGAPNNRIMTNSFTTSDTKQLVGAMVYKEKQAAILAMSQQPKQASGRKQAKGAMKEQKSKDTSKDATMKGSKQKTEEARMKGKQTDQMKNKAKTPVKKDTVACGSCDN